MSLMPPLLRNIELKARCSNLPGALAVVQSLSPVDTGIQLQIDTYFHVTHGRLKLREIVNLRAELIWYDRSNEAKSRNSDYRITPISHPNELKASLAAAMGSRGEVIKRRHVLLWHNVRIHLDEVEKLGTFIEFEAVLSSNEDAPTGHERLRQLCELLKITPADYLDGSYATLMGLE